VGEVPLTESGVVKFTLPKLVSGLHSVRAEFVPADTGTAGSKSSSQPLWIIF